MFIPKKALEDRLKQILYDDIGQGDVTVDAIVPKGLSVEAEIIAKEDGVAAGIEECTIIAESLGLKTEPKVADGEEIRMKQVLIRISGDAKTLLSAERTMLNLLSRMSGIATATKNLTGKLEGINSKAKIAATRKTAPGLLYFDKKAVMIGGGDPHRMHLDDMILIKDNHIVIAGDPAGAVKLAKAKASFSKKIEVEITKTSDAVKVAEAGADIIMLDNFSPIELKKAIDAIKKAGFLGQVLLEVSGGITSENFLEYATSGVDIISIGQITHTVRALDISLEITKKLEKTSQV